MIINKRNKKLGRLDREVVVKEREDREKRKLEAEERKKRFIEEAKAEQQKKENNKLSNKVEDRVKDFCLSNGLNIKTLGTIVRRFAEHKMALDKDCQWEQMVLYNPWDSLMSVQGNSFVSADKVGMALGFNISDPKRLVAYVQKALEDTTKGSTILPLIDIIKVMMSDLNLRDLNGVARLLFDSNGKGFLLLGSDFKRVSDPNKARFLTKSSWYEAEKNWFLLLNNIQNNEINKIDKDIKDFAKGVHVYSLNEKQLKCIDEFDDYNVNILNGIGGCYEAGTEVLTRSGWINIEDWCGQEIMEAYATNKVGIKGKFSKPIQFHKYKAEQFYRMKGNTVDLTVSENHNNLIVSPKHFYTKSTTKDLFDVWNDKVEKIHTTNKVATNFIHIPETFEWYGDGLNYSDDYIRLKIAVFADGYFGGCSKSRPNMCYVNIKKERKKIRLEMLLDRLNIAYTTSKSAEGYKRYYFEMDNTNKVVDKSWFFNTNKHQREIIMEEILLWDGSIGSGGRIGTFTSVEKETVDTIQLIAHSLGYRANIIKDKRTFEKYRGGVCYDIRFSRTKFGHKVFECSKHNTFEKVNSSSEYMYCFTTTSGNFVVRQKDKIYVSGNSGKTSVMKSVLTTLKKARQTFTCVAPTGIASKMFRDATGEKCVTVHSRCSQSAEMIDTDWLVLEEFGMYSVVHMNLLLSKMDIKNPPRILMVGDINQLQPICAGSFFRDTLSLIECGKIRGNVMTLTEIMRAKSDTFIPHLGKMFTGEEKYDPIVERLEYKNVMFHSLDTDITKQVLEMFKRYDLNAEDTYVLSPMNKGDFGNTLLNNELDKHLGGEIIHQDRYNSYRKNSIYMHTKNNRELGIYNGEKIRLKNVDFGDWSFEKLHDSESIIYDYDVFKSETQLSYANSIHKVQGLTSKNVVVILSKHHSFMLNRELVYTALSRASDKLIILYDEGMLNMASKKKTVDNRVTFLGELSK